MSNTNPTKNVLANGKQFLLLIMLILTLIFNSMTDIYF